MSQRSFFTFIAVLLFSIQSFAQKEIDVFVEMSKSGCIVSSLAFSPDNQILASGCTNGDIVLWDLNTFKESKVLKGHLGGVEALAFDAENGMLYSVARDNRLIGWKPKIGKIEYDVKAHDRDIYDLRIDYFRGNVITASADKTISIWDKSTGQPQKTFYGHERDVKRICISSDSKYLFSTGPDLLLKTWDLNNGSELKSLNMGSSWIYDISCGSNSNTFVTGGNDKTIKIWDDQVYQPISEITSQKSRINALDISGNGEFVASGNYDKTANIFKISDGSLIAELKKHKAELSDILFSNDGKYLATSEVGQSVRLFDIESLNAGKKEIIIPNREGGAVAATSSSQNSSTSSSSEFNDEVAFNPLELGQNHLLLISINDYEHWPRLNNAANDAADVEKILKTKYQFKDENVYSVANQEATLENIHDAFQELRKKVGEKDNLLIFYSGHGFYDRALDEGYWIPVDAENGKTTDYLPNSNLLKYIKALDSKHVFLVADACFSGSLFSPSSRGYVENVEKYKSRWALTSGRLEYVSDGNYGARNSPFTSYFLKFLESNDKDQVPVSELIQYVKVAVSNNSDQTPIGSPLKNVGDEGGEFIFRKE